MQTVEQIDLHSVRSGHAVVEGPHYKENGRAKFRNILQTWGSPVTNG